MLTAFQRRVLLTLARNRTPESHVAGGAPLNRDRARMTSDIDIFNDVVAAVEATATADVRTLRLAGLTVPDPEEPPRRGLVEHIVRDGADATRIQWVADSAVRFLAPVRDAVFGYRLSDPDLAVNKLLALAGRSTARDVADIVALHRTGFPLSALAWAAPGKDPGFTPMSVLDWATRNASHVTAAEWRSLASADPVDPCAIKDALLTAVDEARRMIVSLPAAPIGRLFLAADGTLVVPTPALVEAADDQAARPPLSVSVLVATVGGAVAEIPGADPMPTVQGQRSEDQGSEHADSPGRG